MLPQEGLNLHFRSKAVVVYSIELVTIIVSPFCHKIKKKEKKEYEHKNLRFKQINDYNMLNTRQDKTSKLVTD
jgi:hypothetical protein